MVKVTINFCNSLYGVGLCSEVFELSIYYFSLFLLKNYKHKKQACGQFDKLFQLNFSISFLTFYISWTTLGTSETLFKIRQSAWYIQIGRCDSNVSARYFSFNTLSLVKLAQPPILCRRFTHLASFHCIHYVRSLDFARFCYNFAIGSIFHHFSNEFGNENAILQCMAQSVNLYFS